MIDRIHPVADLNIERHSRAYHSASKIWRSGGGIHRTENKALGISIRALLPEMRTSSTASLASARQRFAGFNIIGSKCEAARHVGDSTRQPAAFCHVEIARQFFISQRLDACRAPMMRPSFIQ